MEDLGDLGVGRAMGRRNALGRTTGPKNEEGRSEAPPRHRRTDGHPPCQRSRSVFIERTGRWLPGQPADRGFRGCLHRADNPLVSRWHTPCSGPARTELPHARPLCHPPSSRDCRVRLCSSGGRRRRHARERGRQGRRRLARRRDGLLGGADGCDAVHVRRGVPRSLQHRALDRDRLPDAGRGARAPRGAGLRVLARPRADPRDPARRRAGGDHGHHRGRRLRDRLDHDAGRVAPALHRRRARAVRLARG